MSCALVTMFRQVPRSPFLACSLHSAERLALTAAASRTCALRRLDLFNSNSPYPRQVSNRSVAAKSAESALDEFEYDDEEPMERRQTVIGEEEWAKAVYGVLSEFINSPDAEELEIFLFKATRDKRVEIRIDKLTDKYGSPTLGDLQSVTSAVNTGVLEKLGEQAAGEIEVAVSSPGAERPVEWDELNRFSKLPLWVVFDATGETGELETKTLVLEIEEMNTRDVTWRRADVKANSPGKGRKMNKKMREERWTLGESEIQGMRIYVDF